LEGIAQRLLAGGQVARSADKHIQPAIQSFEQRLRWQQFDPRSGKFNGERETIQTCTYSGNGGGISLSQLKAGLHRLRALEEKRHRRQLCQRLALW
jgi:hypothetical protein